MDIVCQVDTDDFAGLRCPHSGITFYFYAEPDDENFIDVETLTKKTFVHGILVQEVPEQLEGTRETLSQAWSEKWQQAVDKEDSDEGYFVDFNDVLAEFSFENLVAVELKHYEMGCGPLTHNVYFLVDRNEWSDDLLISDDN